MLTFIRTTFLRRTIFVALLCFISPYFLIQENLSISQELHQKTFEVSINNKLQSFFKKNETPASSGILDTAELKKTEWYKNVVRSIEASEYEIHLQEGSDYYQAFNKRNGVLSQFFGDRFNMQAAGNEDWELQLSLKNISDGGTLNYKPAESPQVTKAGSKITFNHNNQFKIEYINNEEGVRQNFIIEKMPESSTDSLHLLLAANKDWRINKVHERELHFAKENNGNLDRKITYNGLKVWDANQKELPAKFVTRNNTEFAIEVNTVGAQYPITVDPLSTTAYWKVFGGQAGAQMGISTSSAGDVNGDGFSDVIVGAYLYDDIANSRVNEGIVYAYHGSASGLSTTPNWTAGSGQAGSNFGISVATAGDVNGDGYSDVVIGSHLYDNTSKINDGRAYIYYGSATGLSASNTILQGGQDDSFFGRKVACAGDVNADGYSDVLVSAYKYDNGQTDEGRVFLYYGSAGGLSTTAGWATECNQPTSFYGWTISSGGDVNGDGYSDILIGAYTYESNSINIDEGGIFLYYGSASGPSATPDWTAVGGAVSIYFAHVVCAGDVNGDGYSDILVGATQFNGPELRQGKAYLYYGSATGPAAIPDWTATVNQRDANFGASVGSAGDLNGDGYADILVGTYVYDNIRQDDGAAFLYYGSATGPSLSADRIVGSISNGTQQITRAGISVTSAGDVNGDGYSDMIMGEYWYDNTLTDEGAAVIYTGGPEGLTTTEQWTVEGTQINEYASSISSAGDVNGDGFNDVIIGAGGYTNGETHEGKATIYLGTINGLSLIPFWSVESNINDAKFGEVVSSAGDINGDGFSDIIVGAPLASNGQVQEGIAYVYYGSATSMSLTADWKMESNISGEGFAISVNSAGDVNRDGYSDVIIGSNLGGGVGAAYVYYGSASGLSATPNWQQQGPSSDLNAGFGSSVASAGDVNGDGFCDVIIGSKGIDVPFHPNAGKIFVYYGSPTGLSLIPDWTMNGDQSNGGFGHAVAAAGDINGDGFTDIIADACTYDGGQIREGRVYVYYGSVTGPSNIPDWIGECDKPYAAFGWSLSSAADVNADGYADVVISSPWFDGASLQTGKVFIYSGSNTGLSVTPSWTVESDEPNAIFGVMVASAGDINGDGRSDILASALNFKNHPNSEGKVYAYYSSNGSSMRSNLIPYNTDFSLLDMTNLHESTLGLGLFSKSFIGRNSGRMVWEIKKEGDSFSSNGSLITNSTQFSGRQNSFTDLGISGIEIKAIARKAGLHNKVRARVEYNKATAITGQVYGPWKYLSTYRLTNSGDVLPLKLISFKGWLLSDNPHLEWITADESNVDHYLLERSTDGQYFSGIANFPAKGNNSGGNNTYAYDDAYIFNGRIFYRLKMMDKDGRFRYSSVVVLDRSADDKWMIAPNPVKKAQSVYLNFTSNKKKLVIAELIDMNGRLIGRQQISLIKGTQVISLDNSSLDRGVYTVRVSCPLEGSSDCKLLLVN